MFAYIDQFNDNIYKRIETQNCSLSIGSFVCTCIVSIYRNRKEKVKFILYIYQELFVFYSLKQCQDEVNQILVY